MANGGEGMARSHCKQPYKDTLNASAMWGCPGLTAPHISPE